MLRCVGVSLLRNFLFVPTRSSFTRANRTELLSRHGIGHAPFTNELSRFSTLRFKLEGHSSRVGFYRVLSLSSYLTFCIRSVARLMRRAV